MKVDEFHVPTFMTALRGGWYNGGTLCYYFSVKE